jgi:hypothetical protein
MKQSGVDFPPLSLNGRLEYFKTLVGFIADTLVITGQHPSVNRKFSSITFDCAGIQHREILPFTQNPPPTQDLSLEF